jgi:phospholipase/carboxylesterase
MILAIDYEETIMPTLPAVEIETHANVECSVIWLHGLGANGHDFEPIVPELNLGARPGIRFIFPHAPSRPVTVNGGMVMPAWYDILSMTLEREVDVAQLNESAQQVQDIIAGEVARGIPTERMVLAGFSQGGAVAYHTVLNSPMRLAGLMCLSTYIASADQVPHAKAPRELPVLIQHGTEDPVVPESLGQKGYQLMQTWGYAPEYQSFPMAHSLCAPQIRQIGLWLTRVLQST